LVIYLAEVNQLMVFDEVIGV